MGTDSSKERGLGLLTSGEAARPPGRDGSIDGLWTLPLQPPHARSLQVCTDKSQVRHQVSQISSQRQPRCKTNNHVSPCTEITFKQRQSSQQNRFARGDPGAASRAHINGSDGCVISSSSSHSSS